MCHAPKQPEDVDWAVGAKGSAISDQEEKGFWRRALLAAPAILGVLGLVLYGLLRQAYSEFFGAFGLRPEDVGFGYATVLVRSPGFILVMACGALAVLAIIHPERYYRLVGFQKRAARRGLLIYALLGGLLAFIMIALIVFLPSMTRMPAA